MRMDEMNKLFEEHGFTVERKWETEHNWYRFTISKDGKYQVGTYIYPNGANGHAASQHQRMFVEKMIKDFERSFDYKILMNSIYGKPAVNPRYRNDALCAYVESVGGFANIIKYCENDVKATEEVYKFMNGNGIQILKSKIKNVIFNDPATIVFWTDGSKTVVKAQDGDVFDPEKGLALAISKKALGNKGNYCNELKKWLPKEEEKEELIFDIKLPDTSSLADAAKNMKKLAKTLQRKFQGDPVQKAYDLAIAIRDEAENEGKTLNYHDINAIIGYLGEALED